MTTIYKITNKINGKIYIGKTKNFEKRMRGHKNSAENGKGRTAISRAIRKYGWSNFAVSILSECEESSANEEERRQISFLNSTNSSIGYNISLGGDGGNTFFFANETEKETYVTGMKLRAIENWNDPVIRAKYIESQKNVKSNMEYRNKISNTLKQKLSTEFYKAKWSECKKGKKHPGWKGYIYVESLTKNFSIGIYETLKEANSANKCSCSGEIFKNKRHQFKRRHDKEELLFILIESEAELSEYKRRV